LAGPYKRIMVTKKEVPHDFPKPHMDFLEHTVSYRVPADKVDDLVAFDASMTINATAGEMSARCDLEGHNILTLNLARDIIEGKKSVKQARAAFAEHVVEDVGGKHPEYVETLLFTPEPRGAEFPDAPNIPGSPVRGTTNAGTGQTGAEGTDAEVLAFPDRDGRERRPGRDGGPQEGARERHGQARAVAARGARQGPGEDDGARPGDEDHAGGHAGRGRPARRRARANSRP
jgi:hypothetical protein